MSAYDVAVIGAGPAGYAAAVRAWDYGKRVALIERGPLGGAGIHNGALHSKTLWELSRDYRKALRRDRGFTATGVTVDFASVLRVVRTAASEKTDQLSRQLDALSHPTAQHPGSIKLIHGSARFVDPHTLTIEGPLPGDGRTIHAENIILATGSHPRGLPDVPVDGEYVLTSDHFMQFEAFPKSIVIIGAGVIGCELATMLANFGQTKVYLLDRADRILPFEDADVARLIANNLEDKGVTIHQSCALQRLEVINGRVAYTIRHKYGGLETIHVDKAMVSVGREPNTSGLGLEAAGVELTERGHIRDRDTRTSAPHIYAVGDVTQDLALVSVGEIEGRHAVDLMYGTPSGPLPYDNISTIMFLEPEVAGVGLNELQAQAKRVPYKVARYGYNLVSRAIAMRATQGFIKILVSNDDEMRILGMRALGAHASTSIEACSLMIRQGRPVRELAELMHPHPAVTEALQDCVRMLLGSSILKPHVFPNDLRLSEVVYDAPPEPKPHA